MNQKHNAAIFNLWNNPKKAKNAMRNEKGGRCCLCVIEDTANYFGFESHNDGVMPTWGCFNFMEMDRIGSAPTDLENIKLTGRYFASTLNDGTSGAPELSHKEIAILLAKKLGYDNLAVELQKKLDEQK